MADFASMMFQNAARTNEVASPDLAEAYQKGAAIAIQKEQIEIQKQELANKKLQVQAKKQTDLFDVVKIANQTKDPALRKQLLTKVLPAKVNAFGLGDVWTPDTLDMIAKSEAAQTKILGLELQLREQLESGEIDLNEAYARATEAIGDPELLAKLDTDALYESSKFAKTEEGKDRRAKMVADSQFARQRIDIQAAGPKSVAQKIGTDFAKFESSGGLAAAEAKLKKLENVVKQFENGDLKTGGAIKALQGATNVGLALTDPKLKAATDDLRASINLKSSLDSQFSAAEAKQQYDMRTIDPALPTAENAARARAMYEEAKADLRNALDAFRQQGFTTEGAEVPVQRGEGTRKTPMIPKAAGMPKLDDPKDVQEVKAWIGDSFQKLRQMAQKYGISVDELSNILDGEQ